MPISCCSAAVERIVRNADPARDSAVTFTADSSVDTVSAKLSMIGRSSRRSMFTNRQSTATVINAVSVESTATDASTITAASLTSPNVKLATPVRFV